MAVVVTRLSWLHSVRVLKAWTRLGLMGQTIWNKKAIREEWCCGRLTLSHVQERQEGVSWGQPCRTPFQGSNVSGGEGQKGGSWEKDLPPHFPQVAAAPVDTHQQQFLGHVGELVVALYRDGQNSRQITPWACAPVLCNEVEEMKWKLHVVSETECWLFHN